MILSDTKMMVLLGDDAGNDDIVCQVEQVVMQAVTKLQEAKRALESDPDIASVTDIKRVKTLDMRAALVARLQTLLQSEDIADQSGVAPTPAGSIGSVDAAMADAAQGSDRRVVAATSQETQTGDDDHGPGPLPPPNLTPRFPDAKKFADELGFPSLDAIHEGWTLLAKLCELARDRCTHTYLFLVWCFALTISAPRMYGPLGHRQTAFLISYKSQVQ